MTSCSLAPEIGSKINIQDNKRMVIDQYLNGKNRSSLHKGVFKCGKKFKVQIQISGVQHYLGLFDSESDAASAYEEYAKAYVLKYTAIKDDTVSNGDSQSISASTEPDEKKLQKRKYQRYSGIRNRVRKIHIKDVRKYKSKLTELSLACELTTDEVDIIDNDDASVCTSSSLFSQSSIISFPSVPVDSSIKTEGSVQYFTGVLSYDQTDRVYHWIGTWLGSSSGRPDMSQFIQSKNYFEFRSDAVPLEEAINLKSAYCDEKGALCGLIRPRNTCFRGFSTYVGCDGTIEKRMEDGIEMQVLPRMNSKGQITCYDITSRSRSTLSCSMSGVFFCDTGILEMARMIS